MQCTLDLRHLRLYKVNIFETNINREVDISYYDRAWYTYFLLQNAVYKSELAGLNRYIV